MKLVKLLVFFLTFTGSTIRSIAVSSLELSTLRARAALGDNSSKYRLGAIIELSNDELLSPVERKDLAAKAIEYFRAGSESGHAACMGKFALYQLAGFEGLVAKNQDAGLKLLIQAAELKDPDSLAYLSDGYTSGRFGLVVDAKRGRELLEEACKAGSSLALGSRAFRYEMGLDGYTKDPFAAKRDYLASAIAYEENAADLDAIQVKENLYMAYRKAEKFDTARKWQDKAIDSGSFRAIADRAFSFQVGAYGETKNLVYAYAYYNLAASLHPEPYPNAYKQLGEIRDDLAKRMTGSEIAEAQRLSSELNAKLRK